MKFFPLFFMLLIYLSCQDTVTFVEDSSNADSTSVTPILITTDTIKKNENVKINTAAVSKHELVQFAKTLQGIPYKYASVDPAEGFDCSGFITYVFNHFNLVVPRSSIDFTNVGEPVDVINAAEGDLILFTGTIDSIKTVGHMGIVTANTDTLKFIHSTSGRANGVTISNLTDHYKNRFVKVIRVLSTP